MTGHHSRPMLLLIFRSPFGFNLGQVCEGYVILILK
jgi:hypothetical protein